MEAAGRDAGAWGGRCRRLRRLRVGRFRGGGWGCGFGIVGVPWGRRVR